MMEKKNISYIILFLLVGIIIGISVSGRDIMSVTPSSGGNVTGHWNRSGTTLYTAVNFDDVDVNGSLYANDATLNQFIAGAFGGSIDLSGDPWWLSGTSFQIDENLTVDRNLTVKGNVTINQNVTAAQNVSAYAFFGDGGNLTNINASNVAGNLSLENISTNNVTEYNAYGLHFLDQANFIQDIILSAHAGVSGTIWGNKSIYIKANNDNDDYFNFSCPGNLPTFASVGAPLNITADDDLYLFAEDDILLVPRDTIDFKPSGDTGDYIRMRTDTNIPHIESVGATPLNITGSQHIYMWGENDVLIRCRDDLFLTPRSDLFLQPTGDVVVTGWGSGTVRSNAGTLYVGATSGNPFNQDLNDTDSPTFNNLTLTGNMSSSENITAYAFFGDGGNLTGLPSGTSVTSAERNTWNGTTKDVNNSREKWNNSVTHLSAFGIIWNRTTGFSNKWNNSVVKGNRTADFGNKWNQTTSGFNNSKSFWAGWNTSAGPGSITADDRTKWNNTNTLLLANDDIWNNTVTHLSSFGSTWNDTTTSFDKTKAWWSGWNASSNLLRVLGWSHNWNNSVIKSNRTQGFGNKWNGTTAQFNASSPIWNYTNSSVHRFQDQWNSSGGGGPGSITADDRAQWNNSVTHLDVFGALWNTSIRKLSFMHKWNGTTIQMNNTLLKVNRTIGFGNKWNNSVVKGNRTAEFGNKWNGTTTQFNKSVLILNYTNSSVQRFQAQWNSSSGPGSITASDRAQWNNSVTHLNLFGAPWNNSLVHLNAYGPVWNNTNTHLNTYDDMWNYTNSSVQRFQNQWNTSGEDPGSITSENRATWNNTNTLLLANDDTWNNSVTHLNVFGVAWNNSITHLNDFGIIWNRTVGFGNKWNNSVVKGNRTADFGNTWNQTTTGFNNSKSFWAGWNVSGGVTDAERNKWNGTTNIVNSSRDKWNLSTTHLNVFGVIWNNTNIHLNSYDDKWNYTNSSVQRFQDQWNNSGGGYWNRTGTDLSLWFPNDNVGLGDATPLNKLEVVGGVLVRSGLSDGYIAPSYGIYSEGEISVGDDGGSGNELTLYEATPSDQTTIKMMNADTGGGATDGYLMSMYTNNQFKHWLYENVPMVFATNNVERLRIEAQGDINVTRNMTIYGNITMVGNRTINATYNLTLGNPGDIILGDDTERSMYPNTTGKMNLGTTDYRFNDGWFSGKLTVTGGVDPPYVLFNQETLPSILSRIHDEIPKDESNKWGGMVMYYDYEKDGMFALNPSTGRHEQFVWKSDYDALEDRVSRLEALVLG